MTYVHGYSEREAERLGDQSAILEEVLHAGTFFPAGSRVLEAGCGVGAQTEVLVRNSPGARFVSVDLSEESLHKARARLGGAGGVEFRQADIYHLPFEDCSFDHVFVCFVLEHLHDPSAALTELRRVLKKGGSLTAIEGDHGSAFFHPETPASRKVWACLVRVQQSLGHDPLIGRRLYNLLRGAGYRIEFCEPRWIAPDMSRPAFLDGVVHRIMVPMVETARARALELGLATEDEWKRGVAELSRTGDPPDGSYFYTWYKGMARNPL